MPVFLAALLPYFKIGAIGVGGYWLVGKTGDAFKSIGELALIGGIGYLIAKANRWI